jgi:hypothetical protein
MMNGEHADHIENGNPWKRQRKTVDSWISSKLEEEMHQNLEDLLFRMPE